MDKIKILIICLLLSMGLCAQVKDWSYGSPESLRNSSLEYLSKYMLFGQCEDWELSRWQFYKYTLRRDSFLVPGEVRFVRDSIRKYYRLTDTIQTKRGPLIIHTDSIHTTYYDKMVQDSVWKCNPPTFVGFMEWRLWK